MNVLMMNRVIATQQGFLLRIVLLAVGLLYSSQVFAQELLLRLPQNEFSQTEFPQNDFSQNEFQQTDSQHSELQEIRLPEVELPQTEFHQVELQQNQEHYFVVLFGAQSDPWKAKYTHTFASLIKAKGHGPDLNAYELEVHTASWLPQSGKVKVWQLWSDPGRNFPLKETLNLVRSSGQKVYQWGPYPIRAVSYWRGINKISQLQSGMYRYRAIDLRQKNVADCFHAISDLDPNHDRRDYPLKDAGFKATWNIVHNMYRSNAFLDVHTDYTSLTERMGLNCYPICLQYVNTCCPPNPSACSQKIYASAPIIPNCLPHPDFLVPACEGSNLSVE